MKRKFLIFAILGIFLISIISGYTLSNPKYTQYDSSGFFGVDRVDSEMCESGQDFIFQIEPFSCTPSVVRSDLLEEQNVYVFCKLTATKINPLIDVEAIDSVSFRGDIPREISGLGFHATQSALSRNPNEVNLVDNEVGYVVFNLRRQPNESAMPDFVSGNLTARIRYDIANAFGIGKVNFYLPELDDSEWSERRNQYSFWNGEGYLRAEAVTDDSAVISLYSDVYEPGVFNSGARDKIKFSSENLKVGETSRKIYVPGFDPCLANLKVRLDGVEAPDTTAKLDVNGDLFEIKEGEKFLDNRCSLGKIQENGLSKRITVQCQEDDASGFFKSTPFELVIEPKVELNINDSLREYQLGDWLYTYEDNSKSVYLGYIGTQGNTEKEDDLFVYLVSLPEHRDSLTEEEILDVSRVVEAYRSSTDNKNIGSFLTDTGQFLIGSSSQFYNWLVEGQGVSNEINIEDSLDIGGKEVLVSGFADGQNLDEVPENDFKKYYDEAIDDYEFIQEHFAGEKEYDFSKTTLAEEALYQEIMLASDTNQKRTLTELCEEFEDNYPNSNKTLDVCYDSYRISSSESSVRDVSINGNVKRISFRDVSEPSYADYGAEVYVQMPNGNVVPFTLEKDEKVFLNEEKNEYIQLVEVGKDYVSLGYRLEPKDTLEKVGKFLSSNKKKIDEDVSESFGSDYIFTLKDTNLNNVARVSVIPNIDNKFSEANFSFNIGIEKRSELFKLSPGKTKDRIDKLNDSIETWKGLSNNLGGVVQGMKAACVGTGATLTIKNLIQNSQGKSFARQKVMQGSEGWNEYCVQQVAQGNYVSEEDCFFEHSEDINSEVNEYYGILEEQNKEIKEIQDEHLEDNVFGEKQVNTDKFVVDYSENALKEVSQLDEIYNPNNKDEKINSDELENYLSHKNWKDGNYNVEQLRDIEFYSQVLQENPNDERAMKRLYSLLKDVEVNSEHDVARQNLASQNGLLDDDVITMSIGNENAKEFAYTGKVQSDVSTNLQGVDSDTPVQFVYDKLSGEGYFVALNEPVGKTYSINRTEENNLMVFNKYGNLITDDKVILEFQKVYFKKYDEESYKNKYSNPEVKYYETDPYKGFPAIVPVDVEEGWYAATKQTLPVLGNLRSYDESGKLSSFYLCNVGENKIQEFFSSSLGDDLCRGIDLGGSDYNQFPGLKESEAVNLVDKAVRNIESAQRAHEDGVSRVQLESGVFGVGSPAADIPEVRCTDFMSPKECQILFNVCDPVICPSSRCDFGGNYPVKDVIQSGVIGSIALCLPNAQEGIAVPVCLTGVKAGLDNFVSVQKSYQDCLQTSLDTGETVGVCDEIHSVYMCEFFWRQGLPLAKLALPKVLSFALDQNTRGGGEYMGLQGALDAAQGSFDYITKSYAQNSVNAFKVRSVDEAGGALCKNFASVSYPSGADFLDSMTQPDSPSQFSARFDEIPYTTATNPPISQYKVFYHIYAGQDRGAYYRVYLRGGEESSFYKDTSLTRNVGSDYIPKGDYASETVDFTAPSGYKELCVIVNGQEECGFKKVSTSFASEYIQDKYLEEQASKTNIKTEKQCVSGSLSAYSILNPNIQEGVGDLANPQISQQGITRVCSTENPGLGSDALVGQEGQRWQEVGYCGNQNLKCWIDTQSVKKSIEFFNVENDSLSELEKKQGDILENEGKYIGSESFESKLKEIQETEGFFNKLELINNVSEKVFFNNEKAKLLLVRGNLYSDLALIEYQKILKKKTESEEVGECKDSFVGGEISSVAKSKIGQDTTRLEKNNKVYDNVCATFVSNTLIDSGVLPGFSSCKVESTPLRDAILELVGIFEKSDNFVEIDESEWKEDLKSGDVIVWGGSGDFNSEFQHITIFDSYEGEGIKVIHDGGKSKKVNSKVYENPFGEDWYITHVWRASCLRENVPDVVIPDDGLGEDEKTEKVSGDYTYLEFDSNIFNDRGAKMDTRYAYFDGSWNVKIMNPGIIPNPIDYFSEKRMEENYLEWKEVDEVDLSDVSDFDLKVIKGLKEKKNFEKGFQFLIDVVINSEDYDFNKLELVSDKVVFDEEEIFYVQQKGVSEIFFEFDSNWMWSPSEELGKGDYYWIDVPETEVPSSANVPDPYKVSELHPKNELLIENLHEVGFYQGAYSIFYEDFEEKDFDNLEGVSEQELTSEDFEDAIKEVDNFLSAKGDVKVNSEPQMMSMVKRFYTGGILTEGEYRDISGEGKAFSFEAAEKLSYLKKTLQKKIAGLE